MSTLSRGIFTGVQLGSRATTFTRLFTSEACLKCPSCSSCFQFGKTTFFCPSCGELKDSKHSHQIDYFSLIGIKRSFSVDIKEAETKYRSLQKIVHPDQSQGKEDDYCALLNEAIGVIKSPLKRADHLMALHDQTAPDESQRVQDMQLLSEVMEANDDIDEAMGDRPKLEELLLRVQEKKAFCESEMGTSYEVKNFDALAKTIERMRFLERIEERINDLLRY